MKYLLDTHSLIWALDDDKRLSKKASQAYSDGNNTIFTSIVCFWEIAIKLSLNKLAINVTIDDLAGSCKTQGIPILPVFVESTKVLRSLPLHHGDPFDRLLISQAQTLSLTILSKDRIFPDYGIPTLW